MLKQAISAYREALKEYRQRGFAQAMGAGPDQYGRHAAVAGEL